MLFRSFSDRAIIDLPAPLRQLVAVLISWRRATTAQVIYAHIGGRSPILEETKKQAAALFEALDAGGAEARLFMRCAAAMASARSGAGAGGGAELGAALGRESAGHAVLARGRLADRLRGEAMRLAGFRTAGRARPAESVST